MLVAPPRFNIHNRMRRPIVIGGRAKLTSGDNWIGTWFREPASFTGKIYRFKPDADKVLVVFYCEGECVASEMVSALKMNGTALDPASRHGSPKGPWIMGSYVLDVTVGQDHSLKVELPAGAKSTPTNGFIHVIEIPDGYTMPAKGIDVYRAAGSSTGWMPALRKAGDKVQFFSYSNHPDAWPLRVGYNIGGLETKMDVVANEIQHGNASYARMLSEHTFPTEVTAKYFQYRKAPLFVASYHYTLSLV